MVYWAAVGNVMLSLKIVNKTSHYNHHNDGKKCIMYLFKMKFRNNKITGQSIMHNINVCSHF